MKHWKMQRRLAGLGAAACAFCLAVGIHGPAPAQSTPTAAEFGDLVLEYARKDLQGWITNPTLIYAIQEQNRLHDGISVLKIKKMDKQWRDGGRHGLPVLEMLDRQASIIARDERAKSDGVVTEIIVMDAHGLNVAISDPTSDTYQGDEAKYQETFLKGPDAVHVSELEFDESTQQVQTQVSLTVTDPETGAPIGAVTLGIRLDKLIN